MLSLAQAMAMPDIKEYVTIQEAVEDDRIPYTAHWLRTLCQQDKIEAVKVGHRGTRGQWLIHLPSLLKYIAEMDAMGPQKFNPWE